MPDPTVAELKFITKIRENGSVVHLDLESGPYLGNGSPVNRKVFEKLIQIGRLKPGADSLFGAPPQTYHLTED